MRVKVVSNWSIFMTTTFVGCNDSSSGSNSIGNGMQKIFSVGAYSHMVVWLAFLAFLSAREVKVA